MERYGRHELPDNWRSLPRIDKEKLFKNWTPKEYKKYIGALPRYLQKKRKRKQG